MGPRLRKLILTTHIVTSVGWLGGVGVFLVLAVAGLTSTNDERVRAVYLVLESIGCWALVPLSVVSLLTGIAQSLGTAWGLFRHYWVLFKLAINVAATILLLMYMQTLVQFAVLAADRRLGVDEILALRSTSPVLHAGAALLLLLIATILSVYKPRALTPYRWRRQIESRVQ